MRSVRRVRAASVLSSAILAGACGREAERPAPRVQATPAAAPAPDADVAARTPRPPGGRAPVIWIGLDGVDFELVDRLAAEGRMPNWKRMVAEGWSARLRSFSPVLSPVVWTTIATGVAPDVHRVLDFQEVDPSSGRKVPVSGNSRAVPAIWNVASAAGLSVGVVGWWATHPAEEVSGFFVSDRASPILFEGLPRAGVAYPPGLAAGVEQVVAREGAVSNAEIARFLDVGADEIARARGAGLSNPVDAIARIVGATRAEHRIARDLYDRHPPDLMAVYFEGTDAVAHLYGAFAPPRLDCVTEENFARYHRAVDEYYALVDRFLGQWMRRAAEDGATLVVNSDHGFRWGKDRLCEDASPQASLSGISHRLDGVFVAWGARVRPGLERGTASVFDVAPTIAALLDLPVDRRASGSVLAAAFPSLAAPPRKDLAATPVRRVEAASVSEKEAGEYAARLRSLGYLSGSEPARLAPTGGERPGLTETGWNNLGVFLRDNTKDSAGAAAAFEKAIALEPRYATPRYNLALLERSRGRDHAAIDALFASFEAGHAHPEETILVWLVDFDDRRKTDSARELLERGARAYPGSETIARELALARYRSKDCPKAWEALAGFAPATRTPDSLNALGMIQTCLGRRDEAIALFRRSLAIKGDQAGVVQALSVLEKAPAKSAPAR